MPTRTSTSRTGWRPPCSRRRDGSSTRRRCPCPRRCARSRSSSGSGPESPAPVLAEAARDAALLVVGHRGRGMVGRAVLGSTALRVLSLASCPVLVDRPREAEADGPVVVGIDRSVGSAAALRYALRDAARRGVGLVTVTGTAPPPVMVGFRPMGAATLSEVRHALQPRVEQFVGEVVGRGPAVPPRPGGGRRRPGGGPDGGSGGRRRAARGAGRGGRAHRPRRARPVAAGVRRPRGRPARPLRGGRRSPRAGGGQSTSVSTWASGRRGVGCRASPRSEGQPRRSATTGGRWAPTTR